MTSHIQFARTTAHLTVAHLRAALAIAHRHEDTPEAAVAIHLMDMLTEAAALAKRISQIHAAAGD